MRITILFFALLSFSACKKYENDNFIRFRTCKQRIVGTWELDKIRLADGTTIKNVNSEKLIFTKNSEFILQNGSFSTIGNWTFTHEKEQLYTRIQSFGIIDENYYNILKLSNSRMQLQENTGTILYYTCEE